MKQEFKTVKNIFLQQKIINKFIQPLKIFQDTFKTLDLGSDQKSLETNALTKPMKK